MYYLLIAVCLVMIAMVLLARIFRKKATTFVCSPLDRLAIDHAGMVLHAYAQISKGEPLDLSVPYKEKKIFPFQCLHHPKPQALISSWVFRPIYGKIGWQTYETDAMMGMFGIDHRKRKVVVSFRNSQHIKDLGASMGVAFTNTHGLAYPGYLHQRYVKLFQACLPSIKKVLNAFLEEKHDHKRYQFMITGHSLGGVLATLMAIYMAKHTHYNQWWKRSHLKLITFGAPHVVAQYHQQKITEAWMRKHLSHVRCFERSTDLAPMVTKIAKFRLVDGKKKWQSSKMLKPVPIVQPTVLFHYNNSHFNFVQAHDFRKYRQAIYTALSRHSPSQAPKYAPFYSFIFRWKAKGQ